MGEDEIKTLWGKAHDFGIELSQHQLDLFSIYLDELWDWNQRMNLTGLTSRKKMVIELFLDSLIPAPFLPVKGKMLDVGTGAGFPGVPLKIQMPRLETHLLEANSKKVSFLKHVIRLLRLNHIEVIRGRIEKDGGNLYPAGYQIVTARAVAGLLKTVEWCAPFLEPGGLLVSFLGRDAGEDLNIIRQIMEKQRLVLHEVIPYVLPGKKFKRNTLIFKKEA